MRPKAANVTDHAHNELLEIAAEQGLFGVVAVLWLWATAVRCGFRACWQKEGPERRVLIGFLGATVLFMLHGLVDVDLRYLPNQSLLWLLMGLLVGADATPSRWRPVQIQPVLVRGICAAGCACVGIWLMVVAVVHPTIGDLQDRRARIAEEREDWRAAVQHAWTALTLDPLRLSTRYLLAGALSHLPEAESHELAVDQCQRLEELSPDYADVTFNLGQLYLMEGDFSKAIPYLRRAVEINPYSEDRRGALAAALAGAGNPAH